MIKKDIEKRRVFIRLTLVIIWIITAFIIFIMYRGHTLLVDNKNIDDANIEAPDLIAVTVDRNKALDFFRGDRDRFEISGGTHRIYIKFTDGRPPFEAMFKLPLKPDMFLLSIPKMINGLEPWIEEFHTRAESRNTEENDFSANFDNETAIDSEYNM
ncbi:MAG: hypothetical protein LBB81_06790 [Treponema sp.]|jgi:hypothetical protein|nr:hypothetical protein [Treponema sp.]